MTKTPPRNDIPSHTYGIYDNHRVGGSRKLLERSGDDPARTKFIDEVLERIRKKHPWRGDRTMGGAR